MLFLSVRQFSFSFRRYFSSQFLPTKETVKNIDNFIFDCDGVLWSGNTVIDGAPALIKKLKSCGKRVIFLTNNSTNTRAQNSAKLQKLGIDAEEKEIVCSSFVAAQYLKKIGFRGKLFVVGTEGLGEELKNANISYIGTGADAEPLSEIYKKPLDPEVTGVLVGYDQHFNCTKLTKAASYILQGLPFYATNDDATVASPVPQYIIPATGCLVQAIAVGAETQPIIMGKPYKPAYEVLQEKFQIDPQRSIMIGDRLDTDIQFGKRYGLFSGAVLTGIITPALLKQLQKNNMKDHPDFVFNSVKDILQFL